MGLAAGGLVGGGGMRRERREDVLYKKKTPRGFVILRFSAGQMLSMLEPRRWRLT